MSQENRIPKRFWKKPKVIEDVNFDFDWDIKKVWNLDIPTTEMDIQKLIWHFELPFWEKENTSDYNLTPQEVIDNVEGTKVHRKKIEETDLSHPIDIMEIKGRWSILDGLHRLVKVYEHGYKKVKVRIIPREKIPEILKT
jgi:hypothetical protein